MTEDPPIAEAPASPPRGALLTVFLVVVIDLLGFAIVLPLLPRIAKAYLVGQEKWVIALAIGLLFSSFSLMQFIFAPLWGRLSDRIGRRPVLLVGLAGSVVFYSIFGYGATVDPAQATLAIGLMFFSRIGAGIAGATISTAAAVIADCTPPDQRKRGMALIGAAFGVGFTFGPLIAYAAIRWLPSQGHGAVGYVAAGLSFIALLIGMIQLPETRAAGRPSEQRGWLNFRQLTETLRTPTIGLLVGSYFLATFGFANFEATLSLLSDSLHFTDEQNFLIFAFIGFVLVFVQGGIYRPIAHRWSEVTFIRIGVLFMMLGLFGIAIVAATIRPADDGGAPSLTPLLTVMAIAVAGFAFLNPSVSALISRRSDPARQGEVLGVNQSANAMARILGPLVGNMLFPVTDNHVLPYVTAAGLLLVVLLLTPRLKAG
jgi:MFS family permease